MYSKKLSELTYCPVVKDQWDCVLNDLEEFGDKEFLVLTSQYNIEIFSCCLRLLPVYSSTFHQTNVENSEFRSEDNLAISRIQSLHLLLEVMTMTKSRQSFCHWASEIPLSSWLNNQSKFFHQASRGMSSWFCFQSLIGLQKQVHSFSTRILPTSSQTSPARCRRTLCQSNL